MRITERSECRGWTDSPEASSPGAPGTHVVPRHRRGLKMLPSKGQWAARIGTQSLRTGRLGQPIWKIPYVVSEFGLLRQAVKTANDC